MARCRSSALRRIPSLGLLALALGLASFPGCKREDPEIVALTKKATHVDEASRQLRQAWRTQYRRLNLLGVKALRPEPVQVLLTTEQKKNLEARLKVERDISRQALIREALEKDVEIRALTETLEHLKNELPDPEIVSRNESHYGLALRFLRRQGRSNSEAKALLSRATLHDRIAPGFEIYHFFRNGVYSAWVAQGSADFSPQDLARPDWEMLEARRDERLDENARLKRELQRLKGQKLDTEQEIDALKIEHRHLADGAAGLQEDNATQLARLNSMHYLVGVRDALRDSGIIETPLFDKERSGRSWRDRLFTQSLDLRHGQTLQFPAQAFGLKRIGKVVVVPGSYIKDEHYRVTLSPDGQWASVELLSLERFRNDKVVFALVE